MTALAYACLLLGALATLYFVKVLMPASATAAVAMAAWLALPYVLLASALAFFPRKRACVATAMAAALGGVGFLCYVIFISPDAQGAIAVMLTPLYQLVGGAVLFPICDRLLS